MLPKMEGRKIAHIAERDVDETLHLSVGHIVLSQQDKAQTPFVWKLMYLFVCFPEIVIFADLLGSFVSRAVMVLLIQLVIRCNSSTAQAFVFYFLLSASLEFKLWRKSGWLIWISQFIHVQWKAIHQRKLCCEFKSNLSHLGVNRIVLPWHLEEGKNSTTSRNTWCCCIN